MKKFGLDALMTKLDGEDSFRNFPIHPSDHHFIWKNQYYFDTCLPMAASSCQLFEKLSTALQWIMLNKYQASGNY